MLREDAWLSELFGYPVLQAEPPVELAAVAAPAFVYAKVGVEDVAAVGDLQEQGFSVVDVNVTLRHVGSTIPSGDSSDVALATADRRPELLEIARGGFRYSRFHLDPRIDKALADRIKAAWVESYLDGRRGIELLCATEGSRTTGFLAVLESRGARVIDLVAVAPEFRGRGVADALVGSFVQRHEHQADKLLVGTQIANVPSLRLYAKHGFAVDSAAYVLHRHIGQP